MRRVLMYDNKDLVENINIMSVVYQDVDAAIAEIAEDTGISSVALRALYLNQQPPPGKGYITNPRGLPL